MQSKKKYLLVVKKTNNFGELIVSVINTITKEIEVFTFSEGEHYQLENLLQIEK